MIEDGGATVRDECSDGVKFCPLPSQKLRQQNIILLRRRWQSGMQHEWTHTSKDIQGHPPCALEGVCLSGSHPSLEHGGFTVQYRFPVPNGVVETVKVTT
jgi:hypothetical protein